MPITLAKGGAPLGIRLEGPQAHFSPGDTIIGQVYRKDGLVSPEATVRIYLQGRAKSKMTVSNGNTSSTYRGRFKLVNESMHKEVIFQGPIHIPPRGDEAVWPFAMTIPTHVDPPIPQPWGREKMHEQGYIPYDETVISHSLPGSFSVRYVGFSTNMHGFIEYTLTAQLCYSKASSVDTVEAILPIDLWVTNPGPPVIDFAIKGRCEPRAIYSYHLIPEMDATKLTFSQKTKKFFGSSSVPTLYFNLELDIPTVIQLNNINPLPLLMRVVPNWMRSTEAISGVCPPMKLTLVSLQITSHTEVKCEGTFNPHTADTKNHLILCAYNNYGTTKTAIEIPCSAELPALDVGQLLNIQVGNRGRRASRAESCQEGTLHPTFVTYNIKHTHILEWRVELEAVGEKVKASGKQFVTVLPPSDEGGQLVIDGKYGVGGPVPYRDLEGEAPPPEYEGQLPTFEEAQGDVIVEKGGRGGEKGRMVGTS